MHAPLQVRDRCGLDAVTSSRVDKVQEWNDVLTHSDLTRVCESLDCRRNGAALDGGGRLGDFAVERQ